MDEVTIKSGLFRRTVERMLVKWLKKKLGLGELEVLFTQPIQFRNTEDGAKLHVCADIYVGKQDVENIFHMI